MLQPSQFNSITARKKLLPCRESHCFSLRCNSALNTCNVVKMKLTWVHCINQSIG